jgi:hypothetical protein
VEQVQALPTSEQDLLVMEMLVVLIDIIFFLLVVKMTHHGLDMVVVVVLEALELMVLLVLSVEVIIMEMVVTVEQEFQLLEVAYQSVAVQEEAGKVVQAMALMALMGVMDLEVDIMETSMLVNLDTLDSVTTPQAH